MAAIFAAVCGCSSTHVAKQANAPIGPDFVAAAPRVHIDPALVASPAMNRIEPLDVVAFQHDKADLSSATIGQVDVASRWLRLHPGFRVVLEGHTDLIGTPGYNEDLAMRRMQVVRDRLMRLGITSDRIVMLTYGEREAIDPDNPNDRRVVMFATRLPTQQVVAMQGEYRNLITATWTDRGALRQVSWAPHEPGPTAISHR